MKTRFPLILLFLATCAAKAQIGETVEQCRQRYGEPTKKSANGEMAYFQASGVVMAITFYDGKADSVAFRKTLSDAQDQFQEFGNAELETLLSTYGNGGTWVKNSALSRNLQWSTTDAELVAHYNVEQRLFVIATKSYVERKQSSKQP